MTIKVGPLGCGHCGLKPSEGSEAELKKYFSTIGKKGGKAARGKKKIRGTSEYYSKLRQGIVDHKNKFL